MSTAYLITGANRGIGFGLVSALSKREITTISATVRDPSKGTELQALADSNPNLHIIKLESGTISDAKAATDFVSKTSEGLDASTAGPLVLFQASYPALKKRQARKFVTISTFAGAIGNIVPLPVAGYGVSKAALNYLTKKIHSEHSDGILRIADGATKATSGRFLSIL
ncbi:hypothetical protein HDV00_010889 [Rhizophlyctis rosea]|nr:hypothetical protein HDV00_010889 [Rhizophlyctis rosea]